MTEILTELPFGLAGKVYRSPMPFSPAFDPAHEVLDAYIEAGVDTVVILAPDEDVEAITQRNLRHIYQQMGYAVIYVPVPDFSIPKMGQFEGAVPQVLAAAHAGKTIAIHCHAGFGRTGILAACLAMVIFNIPGEEAIAWVRQFVPHAVETAEQFQFVIDFKYPEG